MVDGSSAGNRHEQQEQKRCPPGHGQENREEPRSTISIQSHLLDLELPRRQTDVPPLMSLITIESATWLPHAFLIEDAYLGDVDSDERRARVRAFEGDGDALSGEPEIFMAGVNQHPA